MGTMRERASGTWELTVSTGRDPATGKYGRVVRTIRAHGKREAKSALAHLEVEVKAGHVVAHDPSFGELLDRWMAHLLALGRSDATLYHYERYIKREIKPVFGPTRLSKMNALDLDRFYGGLTGRGLAPATVRQIHAIMRASLNQGERWGLVGRNVAKLASPPSQPQREQTPPSVEEVHRLLTASAAIDPLFGLYVRVVVATGTRRAEACGIKWTDVDFEAGTVSISRSYMVLPNGVRGDRPTKTRSARVITLDPDTVAALLAGWESALRAATVVRVSADERRSGYVFSFDPDGALGWRPDVVDARWSRTRKAAEVPKTIRIHDLRHWQATQLLDAGVPVPTVAARLGHADGTTTMKVYAHRTERTSQLSGVPKSTVYDWRRDGILVPDFTNANPTMWSYRDLVLLRLLAWLRQGGMQRSLAATKVTTVRRQLSEGVDVRQIHATKWDIILNDTDGGGLADDRDNLLPSPEFYSLLGTFDLHEPIEELRSKRNRPVWAPDPVTPSAHSVISPWVLAGDPCIARTRIPTASIFALYTERALSTKAIVSLYPGLVAEAVDDAVQLERRLRGGSELLAA